MRYIFAFFTLQLVIVFSHNAFAAKVEKTEDTAMAFVSSMANDGLAFLSNKNLTLAQKKKRFNDLLDRDFDIKTIAQFALGHHWKNISDTEKKEYLNLFEDMVVSVYARRFKEYKGQEFNVIKARKRGKKDFIVTSEILPLEGESGPKVLVDWRVRHKNGQYKVIDIAIEGISMIMTQRADFAAVIQKGNGDIEFLLAELRKSE